MINHFTEKNLSNWGSMPSIADRNVDNLFLFLFQTLWHQCNDTSVRKSGGKVHIFWEGHTIWRNLPPSLTLLSYFTTKGQLILKCLFDFFNSPEKWTKKFDFTTMVPQVELFSFIFWENWRHQKDISKLIDL
jgi:hypothetical protein